MAPDLSRYFTSDALAALSEAIGAIGSIPTDRRGIFTGDILDTSSHRYDAWVTSLATSRLADLRAGPSDAAGGSQLGAWDICGTGLTDARLPRCPPRMRSPTARKPIQPVAGSCLRPPFGTR